MNVKVYGLSCPRCSHDSIRVYENGKVKCYTCGFWWYDIDLAKVVYNG